MKCPYCRKETNQNKCPNCKAMIPQARPVIKEDKPTEDKKTGGKS